MSARQRIEQQLMQLGQALGEPLSLGDEGLCALELENGFEAHIVVPPSDNLVLFIIGVGPVVVADREALFAELLAMNYLDDQTQGTTLCLDPTHSDVLLRYSLPIEHLAGDGLEQVLGALGERAQELAVLLNDWQTEQEQRGPEEAAAVDAAATVPFSGPNPGLFV